MPPSPSADVAVPLLRDRDFLRYGAARGLLGSTIGILGLGSIGLEVAQRARAFGMEVRALAKPDRSARTQARADDLGIEALMASACLPHSAQTVVIDGEPFWDGGFSGNPALWPLVYGTHSDDVLLIQINPREHAGIPRTASEIDDRINEITFNASLVAELRAIAFVQRLLRDRRIDPTRYKQMRLHRIADEDGLAPFGASSKLNTDPRLLTTPFNSQGLPNRRMAWIENGFVRNLVYDRYWASRTDREPTGFPAGYFMEGGGATVEDMIASTERGLLLTEFPIGTPPLPDNFPMRNRIIAGLARGTLVVEAALPSGSLSTARAALEAGREVFAIPGSIHSSQSRGCHALIKQGAKLVESADDVLGELDWKARPPAAALPDGESIHDPLLDALGHDPATLDALGARTGLGAADLNARLLELELDGQVARLPGGLFQRRSTG